MCLTPRQYCTDALPDFARRASRSDQIGFRTVRTCSFLIRSTRISPIVGKTYFFIPCNQLYTCLPLRQRGLFASNVAVAASRNVGSPALSFNPGSPPDLTILRFSPAISRASARLTVGKCPRPMSRRCPWMVIRCTQYLLPPGFTYKYNVLAARKIPVSLPVLPRSLLSVHGSSNIYSNNGSLISGESKRT